MKTILNYLPYGIAVFFVLLFVYAGVSKMLDFENFQVQIGQSPLLSAYAGYISRAVILAELLISGLLLFPRTRSAGLYGAFSLMVAFTVYIYLILHYSESVPCSCGGILEQMGWEEHLIFNIACVVLAGIGVTAATARPAKISVVGDTSKRLQNLRVRRMHLTLAYKITASAVASAGLVVALFVSSEYIIRKENNFIRRFLQNPVTQTAEINMGADRHYFAGTYGGHIYLGNLDRPLMLTGVSRNLLYRKTLRIRPEKISEMAFRNLRVQVHRRSYYLYDGTVPVIYAAPLQDAKAKIISRGDAYFTQLSVLNSTRFALRTQSSTTHRYLLALLDLGSRDKVKLFDDLLSPQVDGVFDVDGLLQSNSTAVLYTYYYRNEFIVMDLKMKLRHNLHTIDSTSHAKIAVTELKDGSRRMSAPPLKVNETYSTLGALIFIQSNMRGKYESSTMWKNYHVIDVYRTDAQYYVGSLRIKKTAKEPLHGFLFTAERLYVLQGNALKMYTYTEKFRKLITQGVAENPDPE